MLREEVNEYLWVRKSKGKKAIARLLLAQFFLLIGIGCITSGIPIDVHLRSNLISGEVHASLPADGESRYVFGFDRRLELKEDTRIYAALLQYLENRTGYRFRLHITPRAGSLVQEILRAEVDFAVVGVLTYLQVRQASEASMLVRGLNHSNEGYYESLIVTRPTSNLYTLDDLRGHTFAFGARNSTQGYLIPRIMMSQAEIELTDLRAYEFTKSHFETSNAVISGRVDAGALQDNLANSLAEQGLIRVIARSGPYPSSGIMAGAHVPDEVENAVRQALLVFDPANASGLALYHWERTEMPNGFALTNDSAYDTLQTWAESYQLFGQ